MEVSVLSMLPGYSHLFTDKKITSLVACQFTFCVITSALVLFYIISKIYHSRGKSFQEALRLMRPLKEKIGEIDLQREIINRYLDSTEDKCSVHLELLQRVTRNKLEDGATGEAETPKKPSRASVSKGKSNHSLASNITYLSMNEGVVGEGNEKTFRTPSE